MTVGCGYDMRRKIPLIIRSSGYSSLLKITILSASIVGAAIIIRANPEGSLPASTSTPVVVASFDTVDVPVPADPVAAGTKLRDVHWKTSVYPIHQIPPGALTDISSFSDAAAITILPAGLPVFQQNLSFSAQSLNPVVEKIPAGMRAMTIKVDATTAVEGWARSGSLVDVLLIAKDRTTVVAEKVRILSAERSVEPIANAETPSVPSTVTLLVTQEQCLAVNTAIPMGRIAFALRSSNDEERWIDTVFTSEQLKSRPAVDANRQSITGYLSIRDIEKPKTFALTDGKWIRTDIKPAGFLISEDTR